MKIDSKVLALFVVGLLNSGWVHGADNTTYTYTTYTCPNSVHLAPGATVIPNDVPAGYESLVSDSIIYLSSGGLYDGHPKGRGQLKGSYRPSKGGVTTSTWTLTPDAYPLGVWISCGYAGGLVKIVHRARGLVMSCTAVTEEAKPYGAMAVSFDCKSK